MTNKNIQLTKLFVQKHGNLNIIRGDLYPGGIKCRVLTELFHNDIAENEVVYCGCYFGHSGFALGLAGLTTGKKITLFLPAPYQNTYIQRQIESLNNVRCIITKHTHQDDMVNEAKIYAEKNSAYYLPVGFDYNLFIDKYIGQIHELKISPSELWVSGGSGVSARCLIKAYPNAKINVVNLNVRKNSELGTAHKIWNIPEKLSEPAINPPSYPSAKYYDAKIWQIIKRYASSDAYVWNIA